MIETIKKLFRILTPAERLKLYVLFVLMTLTAFIEAAGVASIMPFLSVITDPGVIYRNSFLRFLYTLFNFTTPNSFLIFIGLAVLLILIAGNILKSLTLWGMYRFTGGQNFRISRRLMSRYIYKPYVFFLDKNSADLGKNILSEVQQVVNGVMFPVMYTASKAIVSLLIIILLFITDPLLALTVISVLGGAYTVIFRTVKRRMETSGRLRFEKNLLKYKSVSEAFGGIKQLKLMGCEEVFLNRFSRPTSEYEKYLASYKTTSEIPHYLMEVVAFGGIMLIVLYLMAAGRELSAVIPVVGLYAFGTHRLMPALQAIFRNITTIKFNAHTVNTLYRDLCSKDEPRLEKPSVSRAVLPIKLRESLRLEDITFAYPGNSEPVIENLSLEIKASSSVAFVGETGSGKTTLADIILGLLTPGSGRIFADGTPVTEHNLKNWQRSLGYIPQEIYLQDETVAANIAFGVPESKVDMDRIRKAARIARIDDFVENKLPDKYDTLIGERGIRLSGGQRQRIGIARAVYHDPEVLVLDEATSALDGTTEAAVFEAIKNIASTKTLIMIAHRLTTVKECDIIYLLENGEITADGTYSELIKKNKVFRSMAKADPRGKN